VAGDRRWRSRGATVEAMALLAAARFLISRVPFGSWRQWLGTPVPPEGSDPQRHLDSNLGRRRLARAVIRGAGRMPGESRCLAQAMALQWMLRRRGLGGVIHLGVRPAGKRGNLDDLHAWVTASGEVLIGTGDKPYRPLYAAANPNR
jgi:hypothetical protein